MESLLPGLSRKDAGVLGSVFELAEQLRRLLAEKVSPRKTDHISASFELRSHITFHIASADPHDAESAVPPHPDGNYTQNISARDAFLNQHQNDPALQTSVAKHLITTIGEADGSSWITRSISRGAHGWSFTYICKDSYQAWARQAAKNPAKLVIGAWSSKDGEDPVNMARPAFDCRGSVDIVFNKSSKAVQVKYEHSPFHKSVAQLVELLVPSPLPIQPSAPSNPKEPKVTKRPREFKTPGSARRRRRTEDGQEGGGGENGATPNQRKKPNTSAAAVANMALVETTGPFQAEMPQGPEIQPSQENGLLQSNASSDLAEQVGADSTATAPGHSLPSLPPGEAERRGELATKLLTDAGIDVATLSLEQFNTFANQSPALQQESLAMLVRYGADRLRIVHPATEQSATPTPSPPPPGETAVGVPPPDTAPSGVPRATASPKLRRGGSCQACRDRRTKCDQETPSCLKCRSSGRICVYPQAKKRASRKTVETEPPPEEQLGVESSLGLQIEVLEDEPDELPSPGFYTDGPVTAEAAATSGQRPAVSCQPPTGMTLSPTELAPKVMQQMELNQQQSQKLPTQYYYPSSDQTSTHQATHSAQTRAAWVPGQDGSDSQQDDIWSLGGAMMPAIGQENTAAHAWQPASQPQGGPDLFVAAATSTQASPKANGPGMRSPAVTAPPLPAHQGQQHPPDGTRQIQSVGETAISRTPSAAQNNPYQGSNSVASQVTRKKPGQVYRPQTHSPTQHMSATTTNDPPVSYSSHAHPGQPAVTEAQSSSNRIAYEPYAYRTTSNNTSSGSRHGHTYRAVDTATTLSNPPSQTVASSYHANQAYGTTQWNAASSPMSQPPNAWSHTATAAPLASKPPQHQQKRSHGLPNIRQPEQKSQARSSPYPFGQMRQQPPYQPPQQQAPQQQAGHSAHAHMPSLPPTNPQQQTQPQNWYGFGGSNDASSGYGARTDSATSGYTGAGSHAAGSSYNQQYRTMELDGGHVYHAVDKEHAVYDILRNA